MFGKCTNAGTACKPVGLQPIRTLLWCSMPQYDHTEVELTVRQIATRDLDTDEEKEMWEVTHENMDGVIREDTPREALEVFAACLEAESKDARINLDDLETEPEQLI